MRATAETRDMSRLQEKYQNELAGEIQKKLGQKASALSHAVARLYLAPTNGDSWEYTKLWGAAVLVIDRSQKSKPRKIQLYDLKTFEVTFEEELYEEVTIIEGKIRAEAGVFSFQDLIIIAPSPSL